MDVLFDVLRAFGPLSLLGLAAIFCAWTAERWMKMVPKGFRQVLVGVFIGSFLIGFLVDSVRIMMKHHSMFPLVVTSLVFHVLFALIGAQIVKLFERPER